MKKIAIYASGKGTNAEAIANYFRDREDVNVDIVVTNRKNAGVHARMQRLGIPTINFGKQEWQSEEDGGCDGINVLQLMQDRDIDLIVLAGFLAMIPDRLVSAYPSRIINIHPSLLPKHGGKGLWGHYVHEDVLACGDKESGITIHEVDSIVDGGKIVFQATCPVVAGDTPDTLADRVHQLEHKYFPEVVDNILSRL